MKRLLKFWSLVAIALLTIVVPTLLQRSLDSDMARIVADNYLARFRGQHKAIHAKYEATYAKQELAISAWKAAAGAKDAQVQGDVAKLIAQAKTLDEANGKLRLCGEYIMALQVYHRGELEEGERLFRAELATKDQEMAEHHALSSDAVTKLAHELARLQLIVNKRWVVGPQVGYGPGGVYVGAGLTYVVVRVK